MSWQKLLLLGLILIQANDVESEASAVQIGSGTPQVTDQTTPPSSSGGQTSGHASTSATSVTPANPTQLTSDAVIPTTLEATGRTSGQPESQTDQTRVRTVLHTAAPQKTASEPRPPQHQETTGHPLPSTTGSAKAANETTPKPITLQTTNWTVSLQTVNAGTSRNTASAPEQNKTTTTLPTTSLQPTLSPKSAPAATGVYSVENGTVDCIKVSMGLTIVVQNGKTKETEYLNIDPNATQTSGSCGNLQSTLNVTFHGGFIRFTFKKAADVYYVYVIEASLRVPSEGSPYYGIKTVQLFTTPTGSSFKCFSKQTIDMDKNFLLQPVNTQLQAFDIVGNQFGKAEECAPDRNKRLIPTAVGLSLGGLLVIVIATCVIFSRKPTRGYQHI
ncbi:lysosome-associated membrane glycoprotein 3 isoform X2 [Sphaerodactylus townsendi]|uniref:lysosome-associated membrane glycoprotein 3 isoform X2 n=1 Tax=Sphaerodactylus townsendi TaxID=933632 RepID=UPI002026EB0A|nr:lysosome-associated membrane glycoprotein 3 isoform X2 [Sphaerodactylus townsendi]